MTILAEGSALFIAALALHVLFRKRFESKNELRAVLGFLLGTPLVLALPFFAMKPPLQVLAALLLAESLSAAYAQTYPALKKESPTFSILRTIADSDEKGTTEEELFGILLDENKLYGEKLDDLRRDGLIRTENGQTELTPSGRRLANMFVGYRKWMGLPPGKG